ncbi:MAG: hypothetical protein BWY74_01256 [Firmicutes bacterium ADurb.Bin419]|nr:MAG: hypothetical protein BWY74_01256 [Firmicutes bacterium ADurb.Bin419]
MFVEVINNDAFDFYASEVQRILSDQPGYSATSWARKFFGNGSGGYYVPAPAGSFAAIPEMQTLLSNYPQFSSLPTVLPPNTFTALAVTDDVVYATGDFVNHGKIATGAILSETYVLNYGGVKRIILIYRDGQVVIVNMNTDTYHYYNSGFLKPWKPIYIAASNDLVFICATSPDLFKINLTSNTITYTTTKGVTISNTTSGLQDRVLGTDGRIYFGTNVDGRVWVYNPTTNAINYLGQQYAGVSTYVYFLGGDADYSYAILRQAGNYWLSVIKNSDQTKTTIGLPTDGYKGGNIVLYQDGANKFWQIILSGSATKSPITKNFKNGVEHPEYLTSINLFETEQNGYLSYNTNIPENFPTLFSVEVSLEEIPGLTADSKLYYKIVGEGSFRELSFSEVVKSDYDVNTMSVDTDDNMIGGMYSYGPVFKWDTNTDTIDQIHQLNIGTYAMFPYSATKKYIGGYPNQTLEWNPANAWDFLTNPFTIDFDVANAFYHYFYAKNGDWLYSAQEISRNDYGATISMYNTVTQEIIVADAGQIDLLKTQGISYFFAINGGDKLVLIGRPVGASIYPMVYVWDISSNKNVNEVTPISFQLNINGLYGGFGYPIATDTFIGMVGNVVYKVVLSPFSITYKNLPSSMYPIGFWKRSADQNIDGKILFLGKPAAATYLYELDGVAFTAKRKSSDLGAQVVNRKLTIANGKLYAYGGETSISQNGGQNNKYFLESLTL